MKVEASGSLTAPIYVIVIILALGFSFMVKAQAPARGNSPAKLHQRILELYQQGRFRDAILLAERLVVFTKRARGDEDPGTEGSLNNLAPFYEETGEYAKAEPLYQEALRINPKVLGPELPNIAVNLNSSAALYHDMGEYKTVQRSKVT